MHPLVFVLCAGVLYLVTNHAYGKYQGKNIFKLNPDAVCSCESLKDNVDFVPARKPILFGHHFTSIAGIGSAVAIINIGNGFW